MERRTRMKIVPIIGQTMAQAKLPERARPGSGSARYVKAAMRQATYQPSSDGQLVSVQLPRLSAWPRACQAARHALQPQHDRDASAAGARATSDAVDS